MTDDTREVQSTLQEVPAEIASAEPVVPEHPLERRSADPKELRRRYRRTRPSSPERVE